jgi:protein required for attachment to host cells
MKPVCTLVLLANQDEARFLINDGVGKGLRSVLALAARQFPEIDNWYSDRSGRGGIRPDSGGQVQAYDRHESEDEMIRERFARRILEALAQEWAGCGAGRLIVAAPAKMLGHLRAGLSSDLRAALVADMPKDLLKIDLRDLPYHFKDVAAF